MTENTVVLDEDILSLVGKHLKLVNRGKVRNTYALPDPRLLLVVASDRISVFDFVLNALVADKGEILTAMNVFWRKMFSEVSQDLYTIGGAIDEVVPPELRNNAELQRRAIVVYRLEMVPVECIVRGYLVGSGWDAYQSTGTICGHHLPAGLRNGMQLPEPLFTPTTKAQVGHDEHIDARLVGIKYGEGLQRISLDVYEKAAKYAFEKGIIIVDTKFEMGWRKTTHNSVHATHGLLLADEILTPDSSRFWDSFDHLKSQAVGALPKSYDKQVMRDHAKGLGIHAKDPKKEEDRIWVSEQVIDPKYLDLTTKTYHEIFLRLTGMTLAEFQRKVMYIM